MLLVGLMARYSLFPQITIDGPPGPALTQLATRFSDSSYPVENDTKVKARQEAPVT